MFLGHSDDQVCPKQKVTIEREPDASEREILYTAMLLYCWQWILKVFYLFEGFASIKTVSTHKKHLYVFALTKFLIAAATFTVKV